MQTNTTPEQIKAILKALEEIHVRPFTCKSCDPKTDAQRNLEGLTYYVGDSTLRFHHSRVNSCFTVADGLLLVIGTSDAMDMHNTRRGHRYVAFDVFRNSLLRPELEAAKPSDKAARKVFEADLLTVNLASHYRSALARQLSESRNRCNELERACGMIESV